MKKKINNQIFLTIFLTPKKEDGSDSNSDPDFGVFDDDTSI